MDEKHLKICERKIPKKETWKNSRKRKISIYRICHFCKILAIVSLLYRKYIDYTICDIQHTLSQILIIFSKLLCKIDILTFLPSLQVFIILIKNIIFKCIHLFSNKLFKNKRKNPILVLSFPTEILFNAKLQRKFHFYLFFFHGDFWLWAIFPCG